MSSAVERQPTYRGTCWVSTLVGLVLIAASAFAAYTEPRLALLRATPIRSSSTTISLRVEGSFSFADVVQLGMPLEMVVTQGQLTARFDLNGNVFTRVGGGPEQSVPGPGIVSVTARQIILALPNGFASGAATIQAVATYEERPISSNRLVVTL